MRRAFNCGVGLLLVVARGGEARAVAVAVLNNGDTVRNSFVAPLAAWIDDFTAFLGYPEDETAMGAVLRSASTGQPAGDR